VTELELSRTVATLVETLNSDRALNDAFREAPHLRARAAKLRTRCRRALAELDGAMAEPGGDVRHLAARLSSYEHRLGNLTYDATLIDLGAAG
jgi:hypothetical protein